MKTNFPLFTQTSIIATIGPKTNSVEKLTELAEAGMNIGMLMLCESPLGSLADATYNLD
jgi:pyruvate kinase